MPEWLLGAVVGAVLAFLLAQYGPRAVRRTTGRLPVAVHVETDPSLIHAGDLNWDGYSYVVPERVATTWVPPGGICREWKRSIWREGAFDADRTEVLVTVQGLEDAAVVIDGVRVWIVERLPISGVTLRCLVGGADGYLRGLSIDLDADGLVLDLYPTDEDAPRMPRSFTVAKGETERFYLVAEAGSGAYRWTADLILLVDGRREIVSITDDGDPFRTSGTDGLSERRWIGDAWEGTPG